MGMKLYVGNLPYGLRDHDLQQSFTQFGNVVSAKVMMERDTGRSKGFGFVEMGSDSEAQTAIQRMNGQTLGGRSIVVNEARPMEARTPRTQSYGGSLSPSNGHAGRNEDNFRSPYGIGSRNRGSQGNEQGNPSGNRFRNN
ncbi:MULTISPECIES: RNA recognition motif domain-containing protein [Comamonas]|jgi:cold-inducible RNA-binding protein|uniref:RNA recognition motif domain-containing protein n=1 Tax=Comamonas TaxID=283 RepID=UPI00257FD44F|nr:MULTISPECIES: RNA-binding protein [Comamonas]